MPLLAIIFSILLFQFPGELGAQGGGVEEEVRLNEFRGTAAGTPPVPLPLGGNELIVLWEDFRDAHAPFQHAVFGQILLYPQLSGGNRLLTPRDGFSGSPDAVAAGKSGFLLVWQEYSPTVGSSSIFCRTVGSDCSIPAPPFLISTDSTGYPSSPRIARASATGVSGVTWQQSGAKSMILLRTFDDQLNMLSDPRGQNAAQSLSALFPALAMQPEGWNQIVWIDKGDLKRNIVTQCNSFAGVKLGPNREISAFSEDLQISSPEIALMPEARYVCAWADARDSSWSLFAQMLGSEGMAEGNNLRVNESRPVTIMPELAVAVNDRREFLVVWESPRTGTITLAAQWFDAAGTPLGGNFSPVSEGSFDSRNPALRCEGGEAWLAWLDNRATDSPALFDVYVKRIHPPSATAVGRYGIAGAGGFSLEIYPNPFSSGTSVRLRGTHPEGTAPGTVEQTAERGWSAQLYDRLGRRILDCTPRLEGERLRLHSADFPGSGVFYLCVWDGRKMATARLDHYR